jgi:hypothetical protein
MQPTRTVRLEFHPVLDDARGRKAPSDGLSTVATVGPTLWVADDESASVERLTLRGDTASEHVQFAVGDFVAVPSPGKGGRALEIDIEGMACADGDLWLAGSHSARRCSVDPTEPKAAKRLARTEPQDNRFLVTGIPLESRDGLPVPVRRSGPRRAQRLWPAITVATR